MDKYVNLVLTLIVPVLNIENVINVLTDTLKSLVLSKEDLDPVLPIVVKDVKICTMIITLI